MEAGHWEAVTDSEWPMVENIITQLRAPLLGFCSRSDPRGT